MSSVSENTKQFMEYAKVEIQRNEVSKALQFDVEDVDAYSEKPRGSFKVMHNPEYLGLKEEKAFSDAGSHLIDEILALGIEVPAPPTRSGFVPQLTRYRWVMLFFLAGNILMESSMCLAIAPVAKEVAIAYNVNVLTVNMCSIIFSATYVIFTFVAMPLYTKINFCTVIRLGCVIMCTGCWVRSMCYFTKDFWPVLLGSIWLSCAYPIYLSAVGLVVTQWFPDHQRAIATTICGLALPCGNLVAFTMTGVAFAGTSTN